MLLIALALKSQQSKSLESCSTVSEVTKADVHLGSAFLWCAGYISALKPYEFEGKNTAPPSYLKLAAFAVRAEFTIRDNCCSYLGPNCLSLLYFGQYSLDQEALSILIWVMLFCIWSIVLVFHEPLLVVMEASWDSKTLYSHITVHSKQLYRQK